MAFILNIETSSPICSVCLSHDGKVIGIKEANEEQNHASVLAPFIDDLIKSAGIRFKDLSAVAVSSGPGSYTGLRIGTSTAKGICFALNIPLIALDSLEIMANGYIGQNMPEAEILLCPLIDARRMEVYYALFSNKMEPIILSMNTILDTMFLSGYKNHIVHLFGSGAQKLKQISFLQDKWYFSSFTHSSKFMSELSYKSYIEKKVANLAYFEPNYIKPFYDNTNKIRQK